MRLDTKTTGELCFRLGAKFPDAEISVIRAKDIKEVLPPEGHEQDNILKLMEGENLYGVNLTELEEGIDCIEDMITFIEYQYSNVYIMSEKNENRFKRDVTDFEKISDKLFVGVENASEKDEMETEGLCSKILEGTDLSMVALIDISDYCRDMTEHEKRIFYVPKDLCESVWNITQEELFEKAVENTGNRASATEAEDIFDKEMTDDEKKLIDEAYKEGLEKEKFEEENSVEEDDSYLYEGWDDYKSEWDEEEPEETEENDRPDEDLYKLEANALCLYGPYGLYGLSTICDKRFLMELCNKKMVQAAYILPLSRHECLFLPDNGYDRFLLRKAFKEDLEIIEADEDRKNPIISNNIYRYSLSDGLETV
jgi:hypothetical protein